jgi:hypothetical protein
MSAPLTRVQARALIDSLPLGGPREKVIHSMLLSIMRLTRALTEEDLAALDRFYQPDGSEGPAKAKVMADIRTAVRLTMFFRSEIEERCLKQEELTELQPQLHAEAAAEGVDLRK